MTATDSELLHAWRDGDSLAGNELFSRYYDLVYRFFSTKAEPASLDDLVQKTFLGCVGGRDRFRGDASFRTYIYATARNVLYQDFDRRRRDGARFEPEWSSVHDLAPTPSAARALHSQQQLLAEALRRIPVNYQIALELYHYEGLVAREVGTVLGVPEPTIRTWLHRGKQKLREQLEKLAASPSLLESTLSDLARWV